MERFQHQYGPDHYLSKAALTAADYNIGLLRRAVEEAGLQDQTTLMVVSDHGFHTVTHSVNVYPLFAQSRLTGKVNLNAGYWNVLVELTPEFDPKRDGKTLDDVLDDVASLDGVSRVVRPDELHALGLPRYEEDPHMLGQYIIIGDVDTRAVADEQGDSTRRISLRTSSCTRRFSRPGAESKKECASATSTTSTSLPRLLRSSAWSCTASRAACSRKSCGDAQKLTSVT
jgi:hypothetical protein